MSEVIAKLLAALQIKISGVNFNNWIRPAHFRLEASSLVIEVPNKFIRDWITENYLELIKYELFRIAGQECQVDFAIVEEKSPADQPIPVPEVAPSNPKPAVKAAPSNLNPKYSFENFVVGSSNQFAHAAAKAVANLPALAYNPFLLYGGVGLGKTHLLSAVGLEIQKAHPHLRVLYVHSEQFTNELITSIRYEKMFEFRKKYRESCDIFLMDDVQFIAGKERTQEEFFHTFNYLYESRRQVIFTSDRLPKEIPQLEERLRSRFEWGLLADVQAPDIETRVAILQKKAESDGISLPNDVAMYLASHFRNNIRELEGTYIRLSAFASLSGREISMEVVREVLKDLIPDRSRSLTVETVQKLVADHFHLKISDLKSARRHKNLAVPRQIAMFLCRKHIKASFPELGLKFGGKDHSTVVHAVQKIEKQLVMDSNLQSEISNLEKRMEVEG